MSYEENVEIRIGNLEIDGDDIGNIKLMDHAPVKEHHPIIGANTGGEIDNKEFVKANSMNLTADHHGWEKIEKYFGVTSVITAGGATGRIIVLAEAAILTGDFYLNYRTNLLRGRGMDNPMDIECVQLTMQAGAYVNCVLADIGAAVTSVGSGDTGVLRAYDNVTRVWLVERDVHANPFAALDVCSCTTAGVGTIAAAGDILPCGLWPDALQAGAEWVENTDFNLQIVNASVARLAAGGMADPETIYAWYTVANPAAATMMFPKGNTKISTRGEFIYTKVLENGRTQEIRIPDGYIVEFPSISKSPTELTEYSFVVMSVEHAASVGFEHGHDKRLA